MELVRSGLSWIFLIGVAATSALALARSRYAWLGFPSVCFLSFAIVLRYSRRFLLSPVGSAARRWYMLGVCFHTVTPLVLFHTVIPQLVTLPPPAIWDWVVCAAAAAYTVGLYCYLAKLCPPENCVHCLAVLPAPEEK